MSEQKYYVFLKAEKTQTKTIQLIRFGFGNELIGFVPTKPQKTQKYFTGERFEFTKTELSKVMDGALFRPEKHFCEHIDYSFDCHYSGCVEEWINPLIERVPVEEGV